MKERKRAADAALQIFRLQVEDSVLDFLCTALVPELGADVAAGSSCDAHLVLVAVAAVRAFPDEFAGFIFDDADFSVIAACHAVVALRVQFCVHDVFIDVLHDGQDCRDVRLHIRYFDVGNSAARGESLEVGFEFQLMECVDVFRNMDVVAVGDVVLVRYARDDAEAFLEAFSELVGGGFHRCAVYGVGDVFSSSPFGALVVQFLHDSEGKFSAFIRCMGYAEHADAHFIEACIAEGNGAVVVEEELVDRFALLETSDSAVLPEDRSHVGDGAEQSFMAAAERSVAEFEAVFQDFPEFIHIAARGACHIDEVDGDDALIEAAVVFMLSVFAKALGIRGEEGAAAHAWVNVAVLQVLHDLGGNIVRNHSLCCTFSSKSGQVIVRGIIMNVVFVEDVDQFRECRSDPDALFILDALHSLAEDFFDDHGQILAGTSVRNFVQVHEHGDEWSLAVAGHEGDQLVLDGLDARFDFFLQTTLHDLFDDGFVHGFTGFLAFSDDFLLDLLAADIYEWSQVRQCEGLSAVLVGCYLSDDLCRYVAGSEEGMRLFNHGLADDGAVLQHVFQIDQVAVMFSLRIVVSVVEMDDACFMRLHDFFGEEQTLCQILGHFAGHVVALGGIDDRVLVGIFLFDFFIGEVDQGKNAVIGRVALAGDFSLVTVADILLRYFIAAHFHDARFDHILNVFDIGCVGVACDLVRNVVCDSADLVIIHLVDVIDFVIGLADSVHDLGDVKRYFLAVSLNDIHLDVHFHFFHS